MKLLHCEVSNFGCLSGVSLSFSDGFNLLYAPNGSGKSTLLDCIHLALYGRTERSGNSGEYINYKSDSAYVTFDFEIVTA